jgi:hypothetical protein
MSGVTACSGDAVGTAPSTSSAYFFLRLNEHAINMSVTGTESNTIQLTATPLDASGHVMDSSTTATFSASDSSVTVTAAGLVTAHYPNTQVGGTVVIARLQLGNVTHADTAHVRVTNAPPAAVIASFSMQPQAGDSAVRGVGTEYTPAITAKDFNGAAMAFSASFTPRTTNFFWIESSDFNAVATESGNMHNTLLLSDTAHVTLYATSWMYGVPVRDSLRFQVGWPVIVGDMINGNHQTYFLTSTDTPHRILIGVGGAVVFNNGQYLSVRDTTPLDILFADSAVVDSVAIAAYGLGYTGSGNVHFSNATYMATQARRFPIAGTYLFRSPQDPDPSEIGVIYVLNNH